MPIGGSTIGWNNATPADTDNSGSGDDEIRSLKTSVQQAINNEHNFPAAGGADTGYHLLGSARPYYGTQSRVSSSGSDGRLMLTSDTSRLFGVGSGGTVFLGSPTVVSLISFPEVVPQRYIWQEDVGAAWLASPEVNYGVTFEGSGFSGVPFTVVSVETSLTATGRAYTAHVRGLTATGFTLVPMVITSSGPAAASNVTVAWRSLGSRVL